jgi:four helix bundle protein
MSTSNYRDLLVWQKSRALVVDIYRITSTFPRQEMFGLTAQMRSAALSIPCNIAESQGRHSRRDMLNFLPIARGSVLELDTQVMVASDLEFLAADAAAMLTMHVIEIGKMLNGLISDQRRQ